MLVKSINRAMTVELVVNDRDNMQRKYATYICIVQGNEEIIGIQISCAHHYH